MAHGYMDKKSTKKNIEALNKYISFFQVPTNLSTMIRWPFEERQETTFDLFIGRQT